MKYSVTCASFRITPWIMRICFRETDGAKKRMIGSMIRDVLDEEKPPVDIQ